MKNLVLIIVILIAMITAFNCTGDGEDTKAYHTVSGTGSEEFSGIKVSLDKGIADFKVKHSAEDGFDVWRLYDPSTYGVLIGANHGLEGTEEVKYSTDSIYLKCRGEMTLILRVWADEGCNWTIGIIEG